MKIKNKPSAIEREINKKMTITTKNRNKKKFEKIEKNKNKIKK
jgi:hypothetical protein